MTEKSFSYSSFHSSLEHKPGLRRVKDAWAYKYNVEETRMNTDPFVRKAMKLWNPEMFESIRGSSKKATLPVGLESFKQFARIERKRADVPADFQECLKLAIQDARHVFTPSEKLIRTAVPDVCDQMNLDSAAGFSFPGKKKSECVEEAYDAASYIAHFVSAGKKVYIPPCKLALRGHLADVEEPKTRSVWVYPFELTILEGKWCLPYYRFLEERSDVVHFGSESMIRLAKLLMSGIANELECTEVTLDWSGFDASVPNFLIDEAFDIIANSFDERYTRYGMNLVFGGDHMAKKNHAVFDFLRTYFKKTKIMLPDGSVYSKVHGIPSGSFFTQCIGSIVNYIMVRAIDKYFGWNGRRFKILGDDSSFLIPNGRGKVVPSRVSDIAYRAFGVTLKLSKLRIAQEQKDRKFLGYQCQAYRYERSTKEWLSMVMYPERDVEFLEQSAGRVFAYYLLGGCNDETYCSFFRDYLSRYPVLKGRELPLSRGLKRLFRFVLRIPTDSIQMPDFGAMDITAVPFTLSCGDDPFYS